MQRNNIWTISVYPLSDFRNQFNSLGRPAQDAIERLLRELVLMSDPEDHTWSIDCPRIEGFNHAIQFVIPPNIVLIVALDRIELGNHSSRIITLFSCSE